VLLSRLFAPVKGFMEVVQGVGGAARVNVFTDVGPRWGDVHCRLAQRGSGTQGQAERTEPSEPRSGLLDDPKQRSYARLGAAAAGLGRGASGGAEAHRTLMGNQVSQRQLERAEHVPDTLLSDHVGVWSFLPNEVDAWSANAAGHC
jgi:hypothetical protein